MSPANLSQDVRLRRQQLLEALVAFASASLQRSGGQEGRAYLQRHYEIEIACGEIEIARGGIACETTERGEFDSCDSGRGDLDRRRSGHNGKSVGQIVGGWPDNELPIGIYPTPQAVREYLLDVGFTAAEIDDSPALFDAQMTGRFLLPWRDEQGQIRTLVAIDTAVPKDSPDWQLFWRRGTKTEFFGLDRAFGKNRECKHLLIVEDLLEVVALQARGVLGVASLGGQGRTWTEQHWQRLAQLGVRSVTLTAADRHRGAELCEAIVTANRVSGGPTVYVALADAAERGASSRRWPGRSGKAARGPFEKECMHGQRLVAEQLLARHGWQAGGAPANTEALLRDALRYDATAGDTRRAEELERHLWPWLLLTAAIPWATMHHRRRRHYEDGELWRTDPYQIGRFHALATALTAAVGAADLDRCRRLLQEAMHEVGLDVPTQRRERPVYLPPAATDVSADTAWHAAPHRQIGERDIELAAYYLWEQRGRPAGNEHQFWAEAEAELRRQQGDQRASLAGCDGLNGTPEQWSPTVDDRFLASR